LDALEIDQVTKKYTSHTALDAVSFTVPEGSILGLLGPNGAGKTTLIRIINQIINADAGEIILFGEKLAPKHIGIIGYLPEERGLYKKMKVGEQLIYLAQLKGMSRNEASEKIKGWFRKFEIKDWWGKKVEDLSKGMAQKVQFISTVLHAPKLIILDEPFSGFDPVNAQLITDEIMELRDNGSTIIFSTHRMETVEALCDQIVLIDRSKKILEGSKRTIKQNFKSHTYIVEYRGDLKLNGEYELISDRALEEQFRESTIRIKPTDSPNRLLTDLMTQIEIQGFRELIPSMSEIFIQLVKAKNA
jgi:ABC-2 type transport system ATP-binding protein